MVQYGYTILKYVKNCYILTNRGGEILLTTMFLYIDEKSRVWYTKTKQKRLCFILCAN